MYVEYETIPSFCYSCMVNGHSLEEFKYNKHYQKDKESNKVKKLVGKFIANVPPATILWLIHGQS